MPYRALVPERLDGVVVGGRHVASDAATQAFMRESAVLDDRQAAGTAAASGRHGLAPRALDVNELRKELRRQGTFLHEPSPDQLPARRSASWSSRLPGGAGLFATPAPDRGWRSRSGQALTAGSPDAGSQKGSQRRQAVTDVGRRLATISEGRWLVTGQIT